MADFTLTVDVDAEALYSDLQKAISDAVGRVKDDSKIKLQLDKSTIADINREIGNLKTSLKDIGKTKLDIKMSNGVTKLFGDGFNGLKSSVGTISTEIKGLGEQLTSISENFNGKGFAEAFQQATPVIENLQTELGQLSQAMREFKGINFDVNLGSNTNAVQRNAQYGTAARAGIREMKQQALEIETIFQEVTHASDGMQASLNVIQKAKLFNANTFDLFIK